MMVGQKLSYWIERIHEELGEDIGIIVMGDFNDEPFNRSVAEYALSANDSRLVINGHNLYLLNLMWPILVPGAGSHVY
jgi:hypothetical protein